ncbi:hypothetical protein U1Q18_014717 [Sarracenia purpurea var. burkii]
MFEKLLVKRTLLESHISFGGGKGSAVGADSVGGTSNGVSGSDGATGDSVHNNGDGGVGDIGNVGSGGAASDMAGVVKGYVN